MSKKQHEPTEQEELTEGIDESTLSGADENNEPEQGTQDDCPEVTISLEEYNALVKERESLKDQMLRVRADSENFRRRMLKEKEDSVAYANGALITDILTVIDNLERALQSSAESKDFDTLYDGISLMEKDFLGLLEKKWGLKKMVDLESEPFDPEQHEAFLKESSPECSTDVVGQVLQNGYFLHDRVLRSAKVKVLVPEA